MHHLITVSLMTYAWIWGFMRISVVTLVFLDAGVVFLEFAKCSRYLRLDTCAYVFFGLLVTFWVIFRLYLLFAIPIYSALSEGGHWIVSQGVAMPWYAKPVFHGLFLVIYALQLYWFCLILRVLFSAVTQPIAKVKDVREAM